MTWEETIKTIRKKPDFNDLVEKSYLNENLELNVKRFGESDEFRETLKIIEKYSPNSNLILDIGCGNGISVMNFALKGFHVTAVEPNISNTVGAGAIKNLKKKFNLENVEVIEAFAEDINFKSNIFDIVYVRQAVHHANDLDKFIKECVRVLKPNGLLLTIRDHVIFNEKDKELFLNSHPLQKFYGGENAYSSNEYRWAIKKAGAEVIKELKYFDSIINFYPASFEEINKLKIQTIERQKKKLLAKLGVISNNWLVWHIYKLISNFKPLNEAAVPGRMYSYIALKK